MPDNNNGAFGNVSNLKTSLVSRMPDVFRKFELFNAGIDKSIDLSEKDFSSFNEKILKLQKEAGDAVETSNEICSAISGEALISNTNELKSVLSQIKSFIEETNLRFNEGQNELSNVNKTLSDIVDNLSGFKSLVKHLRMLGISTKIESVRLSLEDRGFYNLAEDVEKLSMMITKKSLDIRAKLTYLLNLINTGKITITNLMRTQNEFTSKVVDEAMLNSDMLIEKYKQASEKAEHISLNALEVSGGVEEAVYALQLNNTLKHSLELIKTAFNKLSADSKKKLAEVLTSGGGGEAELLNIFKSDLKNQITGIQNAQDGLDGRFENIRGIFKKMENRVSGMNAGTHQLISSSVFGQNSILASMSKNLKTVSGTIEQDSRISDEMVASMSTVADTIADLSGFVDEIDEIGTEVELIALNASVKAARTGSEGAALGVLAESIQKLSIDAKNQTALILDVLQVVMKTAEKLRNNFTSKNTDGNKEDLALMSLKINGILNSLTKIDSDIYANIDALKEKSSYLNDEIKRTSPRLGTDKKVHDILDAYLMEFHNVLNDSFLEGRSSNMSFKPASKDKKKDFKSRNGAGFPGKINTKEKKESSGSNELRDAIEFL